MDVEIIEELSRMLSDRKLVSREEVTRNAIRAALKVLQSDLVNVNSDLIEDATCSLIDCPLSLKSLHFSEEIKVGDYTFYHPHVQKPSEEDFELAYLEFLKSRRYLDSLDCMIEVTDRFFEGYKASGKYFRIYEKNNFRYGIFYSLIDDVYEDIDTHVSVASKFDGEYVIVVPTESRIEPFLKFFKNKSEDIKRAKIKIWVVNTEAKTIDPFIGYPRDLKLLRGFKNPKVASIVNSLWRVDVVDLD